MLTANEIGTEDDELMKNGASSSETGGEAATVRSSSWQTITVSPFCCRTHTNDIQGLCDVCSGMNLSTEMLLIPNPVSDHGQRTPRLTPPYGS